MKISININENSFDTEIVINCSALTPETERIIAALRMLDSQMTVTKEGEVYILDVAKITYSQQLSILINGLGNTAIEPQSIFVIAANFVLFAVLFAVAFQRKGLS